MGKWIRHNQGIFASVIICIILLVWTFGCQSRVASLLHPAQRVTRAELTLEVDQEAKRLEAELELLSKAAELKMAQLDEQDQLKKQLFDFAALTAQTGTFNPAGLIALTGSIMGFGAIVDNRIKDKVIKNRPLAEKNSAGT